MENYDGSKDSVPIETFISDFKNYLQLTNNKTPENIRDNEDKEIPNPDHGILEKYILKNSLTGAARVYFDQIQASKSYKQCLESLQERFKLSEQEKHTRKIDLYKTRQQPGEDFLDYATKITKRATGLNMEELELVRIIVENTSQPLRAFLLNQDPKTLDEIFSNPVVKLDYMKSAGAFVGSINVLEPDEQKHEEPEEYRREDQERYRREDMEPDGRDYDDTDEGYCEDNGSLLDHFAIKYFD